ncbi:MAG TPA: hypothetical protein VMI53_04815, partial [Opitutaceae bacterium]|nr:hypothetical protein [Opitutaceae bacterium]
MKGKEQGVAERKNISQKVRADNRNFDQKRPAITRSGAAFSFARRQRRTLAWQLREALRESRLCLPRARANGAQSR